MPREDEAEQAQERKAEPARAEKSCEYDSMSGQQAKQGTYIYDESGRQGPRSTCEYDNESGRQVLSDYQGAMSV